MTEQIKGLLGEGDILVLTGDARNVGDTSIYTRLAQEAGGLGAKVVLDAARTPPPSRPCRLRLLSSQREEA